MVLGKMAVTSIQRDWIAQKSEFWEREKNGGFTEMWQT
jgi:hypothetical protein